MVSAMGIQAASIGGGMVVVSAVGGALGRLDFRLSYLVNIINGFISMIRLAAFQWKPESGRRRTGGKQAGYLGRYKPSTQTAC